MIFKVVRKFDDAFNLLNDLSDDINDIKEKLGLRTQRRTAVQREENDKDFIRGQIEKGKSLKELKKILGFWAYCKYKWWIKHCIKNYTNGKVCPKCKKVYYYDEDECDKCSTGLVSIKEYQRRLDFERGNYYFLP